MAVYVPVRVDEALDKRETLGEGGTQVGSRDMLTPGQAKRLPLTADAVNAKVTWIGIGGRVVARSAELLHEPCPILWVTCHPALACCVTVTEEVTENIGINWQVGVWKIDGICGRDGMVCLARHLEG